MNGNLFFIWSLYIFKLYKKMLMCEINIWTDLHNLSGQEGRLLRGEEEGLHLPQGGPRGEGGEEGHPWFWCTATGSHCWWSCLPIYVTYLLLAISTKKYRILVKLLEKVMKKKILKTLLWLINSSWQWKLPNIMYHKW